MATLLQPETGGVEESAMVRSADNQGRHFMHVAVKRTKHKALPKNELGRMTEKLEHLEASVRAKVEHPFHVIMNLVRHRKTRYRGLAKHTAPLLNLFGFANLVRAALEWEFRRMCDGANKLARRLPFDIIFAIKK